MGLLQISHSFYQVSKFLSTVRLSAGLKFLLKSDCQLPKSVSASKMIQEVLREKAYENQLVRENCWRIIGSSKNDEKCLMMTTIYLTTLFFRSNECRDKIRKLLGTLPECRTPLFRKEVELFRSLMDLEKNDENSISIDTSLFKGELIDLNARKQIELADWEKFRRIVEEYGNSFIDLYDYKIDGRFGDVEKSEIFRLFMKMEKNKNEFSLNEKQFKKLLKALKVCDVRVKKYENKDEVVEYVKEDDLKKLIARIEKFAENKNEGFLKNEELQITRKRVEKLKKKFKTGNIVVVDALNFGMGKNVDDWKMLRKQFDNIVFATRMPGKKEARLELEKKYNGNVIFCDRLSQDDMIVLQIAWEFGPKCRVITNDLYRDHRKNLCENDEELRRIWDEWQIDMIYRHDNKLSEKLRNFNIRIFEKSPNCWIVPIIPEKSPRIRDIVRWKLEVCDK